MKKNLNEENKMKRDCNRSITAKVKLRDPFFFSGARPVIQCKALTSEDFGGLSWIGFRCLSVISYLRNSRRKRHEHFQLKAIPHKAILLRNWALNFVESCSEYCPCGLAPDHAISLHCELKKSRLDFYFLHCCTTKLSRVATKLRACGQPD